MRRNLVLLTLLCALAGACTPGASSPPQASPTLTAAQASLTQTAFHRSNGGGEPRSAGYWLIWNTCAEGNQAETARANGGQAAGWILMDDLLDDPGILLGRIVVERCADGVLLLQAKDASGEVHINDPAYLLAAQLFAAELNLAAGGGTCPASDKYIYDAQLLLEGIGFDGTGNYMGPPKASPGIETANLLTDQLAAFNAGRLCVSP